MLQVAFNWLQTHSSGALRAKNCEQPRQIDNVLRILQLQATPHGSQRLKIDAMSLAVHVLQELIEKEQELEAEHWLIPATIRDRFARKNDALSLLMKIVNTRILKTRAMG